jgi:hypothetical protein
MFATHQQHRYTSWPAALPGAAKIYLTTYQARLNAAVLLDSKSREVGTCADMVAEISCAGLVMVYSSMTNLKQ